MNWSLREKECRVGKKKRKKENTPKTMLRLVSLFRTIFRNWIRFLSFFFPTDNEDEHSRLELVFRPYQQTSSTKTLLQLVLRSLIKFVDIFFTTLKKRFVYGWRHLSYDLNWLNTARPSQQSPLKCIDFPLWRLVTKFVLLSLSKIWMRLSISKLLDSNFYSVHLRHAG